MKFRKIRYVADTCPLQRRNCNTCKYSNGLLRKIDARENLTLDGDLMQADCMIVEQKPAWSEEDEVGFGDAMWAIEQASSIAKNENDMANFWYAERWLKSIKERMKGE